MMDLQEILSQPDGFCPPSVTVKIEKVFPRKAGESEKGPWSFQSVKTSDGELKLKNLDAFPEDRIGQTVTLRAYPSKQHGLTGLKVAHEEYQGKTYSKLVITPTAVWEWAEAHGSGYAPEKSNGHSTQTRVEPTYHPVKLNIESHLLACADIANKVAERLGINDDQARQATFATVTIDCQRQGVYLGDSSPSEPSEPQEDIERRTALMKGVKSACKLLNDEGYEPRFTPKRLKEFVAEEFGCGLDELGIEAVEQLLKTLSDKLDTFRLNKTVGDDMLDPDDLTPF